MAKKTSKKAGKVDPKLVAAAEDMNEVMGLDEDDVIDTGSEASIKKGLKAAVKLIENGDVFEDETYDVLEELELYTREEEEEEEEEPAPKKGKGKKAPVVEEEEEEEDEEEEDEEEEEEPAPKKGKKGKAKAKPVVDDDDDEEEEEEEEEKPKKKAKAAKGPKGASAYGTALDILCKDPDASKEKLNKALAKKGIEPGAGTNTAYSSVRSIVKRLRDNDLMK